MGGHRSNVISLEWHPYESTLISGSMDTNVKLWNMRDKDAVATFKGHNAGVTHVKFSPDGNWVASASADGAVKASEGPVGCACESALPHLSLDLGPALITPALSIDRATSMPPLPLAQIWDVRAGRLVTDLCPPTKYEITGLEFSPTEYVLATSARDKVVRFWDLENFSCIDQTTPEATPVRNIAFYTDGRYMFSALQVRPPPNQMQALCVPALTSNILTGNCLLPVPSCVSYRTAGRSIGVPVLQDGCRVWSVEPPVQQDYVDVPWYRVSDLTVSTHRGQQRLIACSFNSTMVGLFYVTLRNVRPFNEDPNFTAREQGASVDGNPYAGAGGGGSRSSLAAAEAGMRKVSLGEPRGATSDRPPRPEAASSALQPSNGRPPVPGPAVQSSSGSGIGRSVERSQVSAGRPPAPAPASSQQQAAPSVSLYPPHQQQSASSSRYAGADYGGLGDSSASDVVAARAGSGQGAGPKAPMVSVGVGVGDSLLRGQPLPGAGLPADPGPLAAPPPAAPVSRSRPYADRQREPQIEIHAPPHPGSRQQHDPYGAMGGGMGGGDGRYQWQGAGQGVMGDRGRERPGLGPGPGSAGSGFPDYEPAAAAYVKAGPSDLEAASQLQSGHGSFLAAMKKRAHALGLIRNFAAKGDWRGAINCARRCDDQSAFADLLSVMLERREGFTLDLVSEVSAVAWELVCVGTESNFCLVGVSTTRCGPGTLQL